MRMGLKSNTNSSEYTAAVVEYSPVWNIDPEKMMSDNAAQYEKIIQNASQYEVDIIVFPECGLTGVHIPQEREKVRVYLTEVPSPEMRITPCDDTEHNYSKVLKRLSYAAKQNAMYVAVNLPELCPCTAENDLDCPKDGAYFYNTNVVFDRKGTVIARYRKHNLFCERAFNSPKKPELCSFDTDFGVTFGMFVCFDILFTEPSVQVVREKNVTDIVYSTAWFSEFPLNTAVAVQAAWSYSMDVNVLASNYNNPKQTGGGSGIYAGTKGPLVAFMPENAGTKLLIARVPKKNVSVEINVVDVEEDTVEEVPAHPVSFRKRNNSLILPEDETKLPAYNRMNLLHDISFKDFTINTLECGAEEVMTKNFKYANNGFSCSIDVSWKSEGDVNTSPMSSLYDPCRYKLYAYSGERSFTCSVNHIEVCGLSLCFENKTGFCEPYFNVPEKITILSVKITAVSFNVSSIPVPSTLDANMYPLDVSDFKFNSTISKVNGQDVYVMEMNLLKPTTDLVTFAIYKLPADRCDQTDNFFDIDTVMQDPDLVFTSPAA